MTDLSDLIARIEAASGPCIGLDADIELATGNWSEHHHEAWQRYQECGEAVNPPLCVPVNPNRFTASIDAALTLVPDGWKVALSNVCGPGWFAGIHKTNKYGEAYGRAATPALALCSAALRARMNP